MCLQPLPALRPRRYSLLTLGLVLYIYRVQLSQQISLAGCGLHMRPLALSICYPHRRLSPKGVDLTGLLGDIKNTRGLGDQKLKLFCETTHNICIKIQQTTVAVTRVDILNDITSKILGGYVPLSHRDRRSYSHHTQMPQSGCDGCHI